MILPSTAERTGGLCMPCKGGYRQDIEESRKWQAEMAELDKKIEAQPTTALWTSLLDRVYKTPEGIDGLTRDEQTYFSVLSLEFEVYNGGLEQYFTNSSADHYAYALRGLKDVGELRAMRALIEAKEILVGLGPVPKRRIRCRMIFARTDKVNSGLQEYLAALDDRFSAQSHSIIDRMDRFAKERLLPSE